MVECLALLVQLDQLAPPQHLHFSLRFAGFPHRLAILFEVSHSDIFRQALVERRRKHVDWPNVIDDLFRVDAAQLSTFLSERKNRDDFATSHKRELEGRSPGEASNDRR